MSKAKKTSAKLKSKSVAKQAPKDEVVESLSSEKAGTENSRFSQLQLLNKWMAVSYGLQALVLVLLAAGKTLSVSVAFLGVDRLATQSNGHTVYAAASQHLFDMSIAQILALSLAISAAFHAMVRYWMQPVYEAMLAEKENAYRWMENSFSFSLLALGVGLVVGVRDIASLAMVFVLSFMAQLLAWQFEHHLIAKREQDARRTFALFGLASLAVWLVIGGYALAGLVLGNGIPMYAAIAYGVAVAGIVATGVVLQAYKRGRGKWRDYLYAERALVILNFAVKTVVVWLLFTAVS